MHEQLAFREEEVEEMRLELEVEKERHSVELEELAAQLAEAAKGKSNGTSSGAAKEEKSGDAAKNKDDISVMTEDEDFVTLAVGSNDVNADDQEDYIKRLEDELEDVTEQLIEAETNISNMEGKLSVADKKKTDLETKVAEMEAKIEDVQKAAAEAAAVAKEELEDAKATKEELALLTEELHLTQEELKAAEEDAKVAAANLAKAEALYKGELAKLKQDLEAAKGSANTVDHEVAILQKAIDVANEESATLRVEVQNLSQALDNAKSDREKTMEEMEALRQAFDEAEENVRQSSAEHEEDLIREHKREIQDLQAELLALQEANDAMKTAAVQKSGPSAAEVDLQTKLDQKQKELDRIKKELSEERNEYVKAKRKIEELSAGNRALIARTLDSPKKRAVDMTTLVKNRDLERYKEFPDEEEEAHTSAYYRSHARSRRRIPHEPSKRPRSSSPTTVVRLERDISTHLKKVKTLNQEHETLKSQQRMSEVRVKHLEKDMETLRKEVEKAEERSDNLVNVVASGISNPEARDDSDMMDTDMEKVLESGTKEEITTEYRSLVRRSTLQKEHNAQLLVKILKLQGNIQVCCRVRPLTNGEIKRGTKRVVEPLSESEVGVFDDRTKTWKSFAFDKVWGPDSHQLGVFQDVEPLALSVVDGYNACIFAYGQT